MKNLGLQTDPQDLGSVALGITGASVGQYAKVKTVDGSGKPLTWEAGTPSGGATQVYAVGDIFVTTRSGDPATLLGYGTWTQIKDKFLLAAGDSYTAGDTGGSATMAHTHTTAGHQLTVSEMPSHGGHVYNETRGGNWKGFLSSSNATSYGSSGRGWNVTAGNELHPAGDDLGGGGSHSHGDTGAASNADNMPPYLVVYMWLRTA